jgi:hypothetical protein
MNGEPTEQQNIAQLVERNEMNAARAEMSKTSACNEPTPSPLTMLLSRHTRRREFIAGLGSAVALPLASHAQQPERMRRIGVLFTGDENDPLEKTLVSAFTQALADLGWTVGRDVRWTLLGRW